MTGRDDFTARKRSLGQDNVFTPVSHSVHWDRMGLPDRDPQTETPWTEIP